MNGLVTSRKAVAAASCVASLATRVLRCTWMPRYNTDKTTATELTNCEIAVIASQFIPVLYHRQMGDCHFGSSANFQDDFLFIRPETQVGPAADSMKMSMWAAQVVTIKWAKTQVG